MEHDKCRHCGRRSERISLGLSCFHCGHHNKDRTVGEILVLVLIALGIVGAFVRLVLW